VEFDACTRCGECSITCPTGGEIEVKEERTPRGKIALIKKIRKIQNNPFRRAITSDRRYKLLLDTLSDSVYQCSICGICGEVCPISLRTIEMWEALRESLVESDLGPMELHKPLVKSIENYDNPWMQPRAQRARWARKHKLIDASKEEVNILYYVGCTASYDPEVNKVAENLVRIFSAANIKVGILGKEEKCCGSTLLRLGEVDLAKQLAEENVKIFKNIKAEKIVTACAGCYKTLVQDYPKLTNQELPVYHVTQTLSELIRDGKLRLSYDGPVTVTTYHDPCHLGRHTDMYDWPREILRSLPGINFVEMERNRNLSRCCGAGGGLKTLNQELVYSIAEKRIEDAEAVGASVLVTSCPFCLQTLIEGARRRGSDIRVADITELVVERLV